jgi:putative flippase GtrA
MPLRSAPRAARYLVVGALNTACSYAVYLILLRIIDYRLAYTAAYAVGLATGYWANARYVFEAAPGARSALGYLVSYGVTYVASLAVLWLAADRLGVPHPLAMLAALAVAVPLSFVLMRRAFARHRRPPGEA